MELLTLLAGNCLLTSTETAQIMTNNLQNTDDELLFSSDVVLSDAQFKVQWMCLSPC